MAFGVDLVIVHLGHTTADSWLVKLLASPVMRRSMAVEGTRQQQGTSLCHIWPMACHNVRLM